MQLVSLKILTPFRKIEKDMHPFINTWQSEEFCAVFVVSIYADDLIIFMYR